MAIIIPDPSPPPPQSSAAEIRVERLLQGAPGTVALRVYDAAGDPVDLDAEPSVVVRDGAAVEVQTGEAVQDDVGSYSFTVASATTSAPLDEFTVFWSGALNGDAAVYETQFTTVGQPGWYFTVPQLRAFNRALEDPVKYPAARLLEARDFAEERVEGVAMVAFVPRGRRLRVDLSESRLRSRSVRALWLPDAEIRTVYSITVDTTAATLTDYRAVDDGLIRADGAPWTGDVVDVHYAHGLNRPPLPIRNGAMMVAVDHVLESTLSARAKFEATQVGTFGISVADRTGSTGIPEVDAVCAKYGRQRPAVG